MDPAILISTARDLIQGGILAVTLAAAVSWSVLLYSSRA